MAFVLFRCSADEDDALGLDSGAGWPAGWPTADPYCNLRWSARAAGPDRTSQASSFSGVVSHCRVRVSVRPSGSDEIGTIFDVEITTEWLRPVHGVVASHSRHA